ncbi:hypothetical protein HMPREF1319_1280 [Capnocytophaga ochracea str. Holt 25]|nr:hypothetical protein HMPREF1319_1280 [Capnocytophaga ochracea str. Holt 25]
MYSDTIHLSMSQFGYELQALFLIDTSHRLAPAGVKISKYNEIAT